MTVINGINTVLSSISGFLDSLPGKVVAFALSLIGIDLPWWLIRRSPSPIELALVNMRDYMDEISKFSIPKFSSGLGKLDSQSLTSYQPTPTSSYMPSSIRNTAINNTFNMGGNTVRSNTDLALMESMMRRNLRSASFGV
jgi:hypothetical protein